MKPHEVSVYSSAGGIGDAVCALYACAGAVEAGLEVTFYSKQSHWLTRCIHPGVKVVPNSHPAGAVDLNRNYSEQLRDATCRKAWYADNICRSRNWEKGRIIPVAPKVDKMCRSNPTGRTRYALLSPFSAWRGREWPISHWQRLALLIDREGIRVAVMGSGADKTRLEELVGPCPNSVRWHSGWSPETVMDAILGAAVVLGNDSGMTHLAGMLGVPTIAIHAQMPGEVLWSHTTIASITPETKCSLCRFQGAKGYASVCHQSCSALGTISPERVLEEVKSAISRGK